VKVSDLGEFGLIERLAKALGATGDTSRLVVGIGDDAAVWRTSSGALLATTDTLVANVHFITGKTPWCDLGWKALAVNLSDIAAMGGTPELALVTLALPAETHVEPIGDLYAGLGEAARAYNIAIAGGDIVRAPVFSITVALTGRAELDPSGDPLVLRRNAARPGDLVAVTGTLGGAAGGLRALRVSQDAPGPVQRHLRPQPRLEAGRAALAAGLRCAIDVSDGLLQDLGHICQQSGLGATIARTTVPVDPALTGRYDEVEAMELALAGGEDYELLVTGLRDRIDAWAETIDVPVTVIGEMVPDDEHRVRLLDAAGQDITPGKTGWDHLRA
jgi:thiamine-monophosphate kinase